MKESRMIAELVREYAERKYPDTPRGVSAIARATKVPIASVSWLMRGRDNRRNKYLGIRGREGSTPLLFSVADHLEIPADELARAVMHDLGYRPRRIRSNATRRVVES